jgi:uncharacterized membrane protein
MPSFFYDKFFDGTKSLRSLLKTNSLYKSAAILYVTCFVCYIIFSRKPDFFDSEYTRGTIVVNPKGIKQVTYTVENITYKTSIEDWGTSQVAKDQAVTVIYNPATPTDASLYSFFAYWLKFEEIIVTACAFIILLFAAIFITGKEEPYYYSEEEKRKKRKYDD